MNSIAKLQKSNLRQIIVTSKGLCWMFSPEKQILATPENRGWTSGYVVKRRYPPLGRQQRKLWNREHCYQTLIPW